MKKKTILLIFLAVILFTGINCNSGNEWDPQSQLAYCLEKAGKTLSLIPADTLLPRNIPHGDSNWHYVGIRDWTSGFWPGILWYLYQYTGEDKWRAAADSFTQVLRPNAYSNGFSHDLGFMLYNSYGNGYRLTKDSSYKKVLLAAADSLATLFNPRVGTILSWPSMVKKIGYNTIIDNMMNLELLFWAAKNGGGQRLYNIAVKHAETTMENQFRQDYSNYHVVIYDSTTGKVIRRITHQGYSDSSMWARGQAWAIYAFTMVYRETHEQKFLDFSQKVANVYLKRLPKNMIPYWDFDAPNIPDAPRDASAAAVAASGLLELSTYIDGNLNKKYFKDAVKMLKELSSANYQSRGKNNAFLMHSTGSKPFNSEVDVPIIYADYYYLEALLRLNKLKSQQPLF